MTRPLVPATSRVIAMGTTESGKSYLLKKFCLTRAPRALIVDPLGEHTADVPAGTRLYMARSIDELRSVLVRAPREGRAWRIVAAVSQSAAPAIAKLLVPPVVLDHNAYPYHVRGMALMIEELDLFAPSQSDETVEGLWRRGRHCGLSVYATTQRPHGVSRIVTGMANWWVICAIHEPNDVHYLAKVLPADAMRAVEELPWRWAVLFSPRTRAWYLLDDKHHVRQWGAPPALAHAHASARG
ncbi:MAG: hypothetical protein AB1762_14200 [Gemmatimonadota bacterium]